MDTVLNNLGFLAVCIAIITGSATHTGFSPAFSGTGILQAGFFRAAGDALRLLFGTFRGGSLRGTKNHPQTAA